MKITPFQETSEEAPFIETKLNETPDPVEVISEAEIENNEIINEILEENNIKGSPIGDNSPNAKLKSFLDQCGGSLERVAINIADVMNRGETEAARLKAAEFISKMHGVQVE